MASLVTLPEEVLLKILDNLVEDRGCLCALALVNSRLRAMASRLILRDVDIYVSVDNLDISASLKKYELLIRSLAESPDLIEYVKNVTLRWGRRMEFKGKKDESSLRANHLLEKLSNIQSLSVDSSETYTDMFSPMFLRFVPTFLERNSATCLRDVEIKDYGATLDQIVSYMALPSIQSVQTSDLDMQALFVSKPLGSFQPKEGSRPTAMSLLDLGSAHIHHSELSKLLQIPASIKKLHCRIPSEEDPHLPEELQGPTMTCPLSPAIIEGALFPLRETLVELRLSDGDEWTWPSHDGSQMDLSAFTALRILHASSSCFFPWELPIKERRGVSGLLPSALRELSVFFDLGHNFLLDSDDYVSEELPGVIGDLDANYRPGYEWVTELVWSKSRKFPLLDHISIEEHVEVDENSRYDHYEQDDFPRDLKQAAVDAAISMEVVLRRLEGPKHELS